LVEWSSEYSADAPSDLPSFDQKAFQNNLAEIRTILTGKPLPILYHLSEGPSTRVLWLSYELGIPMSVIDHHPNLIDLQQSGETERSLGKGGVVTTYVEGDLELLGLYFFPTSSLLYRTYYSWIDLASRVWSNFDAFTRDA